MTGAQPDKGDLAQGGGPGPRRAVAGDGLVLKITHGHMDAAVSAGDAIPLTLGGGWLTGYQDTWWVLSEIGWLRITDEATVADIDHVAARLAEVAEDAGVGASAGGADLRSPDEDAEE
jgi:hypothetical protein